MRLAALWLAMALVLAAVAAPARATRRVLYLTHSAGFKHSVLPLTEKLLPEFGRSLGGFETVVTQDCGQIVPENLRNFDAVVFYTTGELPISEEGRRGLLDFVRGGKGFVGVHSATDTFYKWPEYGEMIGGYFDNHPWHADVAVRVEDRAFPATRHLGAAFRIHDEIYQFKSWSRGRTHVLLSLDPSSVDLAAKGVNRSDRDFALAWCHPYAGGRVFYTALGHRDEVWRDPRFQKLLVGGIAWAMGDASAAVKLGTRPPP